MGKSHMQASLEQYHFGNRALWHQDFLPEAILDKITVLRSVRL